jgi:CO dehydrogenase/acetyl-CoA synthase gamma subunit (corrinoid Fe-S protein)
MARCSVCKGHAVTSCSECGLQVCMSHSTTIFDEATRSMKAFCGNCTAKRMPVWVARRR